LVGHVAGSGHRLAAVALDPGDALLDGARRHVVDRDLRPVPGQGQGDPAADVGPGAGDERDLAVKGDLHRRSCRPPWVIPTVDRGPGAITVARDKKLPSPAGTPGSR